MSKTYLKAQRRSHEEALKAVVGEAVDNTAERLGRFLMIRYGTRGLVVGMILGMIIGAGGMLWVFTY